jgi:hypothetical protein
MEHDHVLYTELGSWLKRLKMTHEYLARLLGVDQAEVREYARTLPVPAGLVLMLKLADMPPRYAEFSKSYHLHLAANEMRLAPHEILGVDPGNLNAAVSAMLELTKFYEARGDEYLVKRATAAFMAINILADKQQDA